MSFLASTTESEGQWTAEEAQQRDAFLQELTQIVEAQYVSSDPVLLDSYAWQYLAEVATGSHYMPRPLAVVLPANTEQVAQVVRACNRYGFQYKAISTGFGMWGASMSDQRVVQIDLVRMNSIQTLDEKNMYAVVEPYVTGNELQTEAMKVGLNTHIAGCGGQCSSLASATSMMGQGMDGISMGFSNRNLLGFEWVTPDGQIVQVGSFDASGTDFLGDGPGFSIRGIIRGFAGALGGLGVFTRAAVKLYPWEGPPALKISGCSPDYYAEIPEHHTAAVLLVKDWKGMAELGYRLAESGIIDHFVRNAPSVLAGVLTTDNNEAADVYAIPMLHELYYSVIVVMTARSPKEAAYKRRTLRTILRECGGGWLSNDMSPMGGWYIMRFLNATLRQIGTLNLLRSLPGFVGLVARDAKKYGWRKAPFLLSSTAYQSVVRAGMNMRGIFRFAGTFWTAMGSLVTWDNAIRGARVGAQIKQKYIDRGVIVDDGADNAWGGLYEGGAYAHLEELAMYDQNDPKASVEIPTYVAETNFACIKYHLGDSLNAVGPPNHVIFSPACFDYDKYTHRIKTEFDPANACDGSMYTDPDFVPPEEAQAILTEVIQNPTPVDIDNSHATFDAEILHEIR